MTSIDIGPFRLIDPPPGHAERLRATVEDMTFPWDLLTPALGGGHIEVAWPDDFPSHLTAMYAPSENRIALAPGGSNGGGRWPMSFVHEVGHMIDDLILTDAARADLLDLFHADPTTDCDDPDHGWWEGATYYDRTGEAYADHFAKVFSPLFWLQQMNRFGHRTSDLEAVRRITLAAAAPPEPTPEPEPEDPTMPEPNPSHQHPKMQATIRRLRARVRRLRQRVRRLSRRTP